MAITFSGKKFERYFINAEEHALCYSNKILYDCFPKNKKAKTEKYYLKSLYLFTDEDDKMCKKLFDFLDSSTDFHKIEWLKSNIWDTILHIKKPIMIDLYQNGLDRKYRNRPTFYYYSGIMKEMTATVTQVMNDGSYSKYQNDLILLNMDLFISPNEEKNSNVEMIIFPEDA